MAKIIVLDTETLGLYDQRVYDLGYIVYDKQTGEVLKERDYIIKQVYDNPELMQTAYYGNKRPLYEKEIADGNAKKVWWGYACRVLLNDMIKYGVEPDGVFAYNSRFDFNSILKTCDRYNAKINPTEKGITDIMDFIKVITETDEYKNFCQANGYLTKHKVPRCQQKAETLYRYLKNETDFIEDHMALSDSRIELEILLKCLELLNE